MTSAVAILTYNRRPVLQKFLASLRGHCPQYPVAVFEDGGYLDDTAEWLKNGATFEKECWEIEAQKWTKEGMEIFIGTRNIGVAGNSNRALAWFLQRGYDHLLLCNDDLLAEGDFVRAYAQAHEQFGVGLFCFCKIAERGYELASIMWRGQQFNLLTRLTGAMMSLTRACVDTVGFFDTAYGAACNEHSTPPQSPVWMGDYTFKAIGEVRVGDQVMGWKPVTHRKPKKDTQHLPQLLKNEHSELCRSVVVATKRYSSDVVAVTMESGRKFVCTPDHYWARFSFTKNGRFVHPKVGVDLAYITDPKIHIETDEYRFGYLAGALAGDGSIRKNSVVLRVDNDDFVRRFVAYAKQLFGENTVRVKERVKIPWKNTKWTVTLLSGRKNRKPIRPFYATFKDWIPVTKNHQYGWLAGMYDAEGSGRGIAQSKNINPKKRDLLEQVLLQNGFSLNTNAEHEVIIHGGTKKMTHFATLCNPACKYKLDRVIVGRRGGWKTKDRIVSVEPCGVSEVVCLTTETGNYVVHGYASKNCDYTYRASFSGHVLVDGMTHTGVDIEDSKLAHQTCNSSIDAENKPYYDSVGDAAMKQSSAAYPYSDHYRPFSTCHLRNAGGRLNESGVPIKNMPGYQLFNWRDPANSLST